MSMTGNTSLCVVYEDECARDEEAAAIPAARADAEPEAKLAAQQEGAALLRLHNKIPGVKRRAHAGSRDDQRQDTVLELLPLVLMGKGYLKYRSCDNAKGDMDRMVTGNLLPQIHPEKPQAMVHQELV
ncbi:hypothetical protein H4582DRAFT_2056813 [Lactarius indigo]|nr:hypothetical protein H4582DRAFT_2056813 [Lactarius indigo]